LPTTTPPDASGTLALSTGTTMAISDAQKDAIDEVISALENVTQGGRYKRHIISAFLDLPSGENFPDYYDVITNPRCINGVKEELQNNGYQECMDVFKDLETIFLNALQYNEEGSGIQGDAEKLRVRQYALTML
jgi:chromatin structure-remodeling complex subunit RSC1/2